MLGNNLVLFWHLLIQGEGQIIPKSQLQEGWLLIIPACARQRAISTPLPVQNWPPPDNSSQTALKPQTLSQTETDRGSLQQAHSACLQCMPTHLQDCGSDLMSCCLVETHANLSKRSLSLDKSRHTAGLPLGAMYSYPHAAQII